MSAINKILVTSSDVVYESSLPDYESSSLKLLEAECTPNVNSLLTALKVLHIGLDGIITERTAPSAMKLVGGVANDVSQF